MISRQRLYQADKHAKRRVHAMNRFGWETDPITAWQKWRKFTACSCWACGTPRRLYGQKTRQERQAEEEARGQ